MLVKRLAFFLVFLSLSQISYAANSLPDFTGLIEKNSPAVVKIHTEVKPKSRYGLPQGYDQQMPELFRHFFGDPRFYQQDQPPRQGMGSGFVVESEGYILTNHHVVADADKITVKLTDRDEYEAELIGTDPRSDLALLKIEAEDLPTVKFVKGEAKVGEWVLAIGSPFGLDYSVSQGIVSAIGRSLPTESGENYVPFIQTDVAINPGNSGGPLFNLDGEVVGINSQIFTRSGGYMGLSFAIPAFLAESVIEQLKENGYVSRGWLGVSIQEVDKNLADSFGLKKPRGALVSQLIPDGPADKGGIENGDIILEFNGTAIKKSGDLPHVVGASPSGSEAELLVLRKGKEKTITMELGELPEDPSQMISQQDSEPKTDNALGLIVENIDSKVKQELAVPGGVVVREIVPESPAEQTGLMPGDVITQLGFESIENIESFEAQSEALEGKGPQPIRFFRRGHPVFRTINVE